MLSDVLGASMQMITINNEAYANATEATVVGPFFVEGPPRIPLGGDIAADAAGEPCRVEGTVTDTDGKPVPRRPDRGTRPPVRRRPRRIPVLGPHPDAPTPSRTTGRWAGSSRRPGAPPCALRTCISW